MRDRVALARASTCTCAVEEPCEEACCTGGLDLREEDNPNKECNRFGRS